MGRLIGLNILSVQLVLTLITTMVGSVAEIPNVPDFFPEVKDDLGKVIWAHAANSQAKLLEALNDSTMMIEADILMGSKEGSNEKVPIMAHPPATTSDLTAVEFIENVIHANSVDGKRKGIKLDFKQYEALRPVLQHLKEREDNITFPMWINADILQGPVNSTTTPIPDTQFLAECQQYFKKVTLSIGWTTRFGRDSFVDSIESKAKTISEGEYTNAQIKEMVDLLDNVVDNPVTFPVRAGIAAQSIDAMNTLLAAYPFSTLTIWSPIDDPVNMQALRQLIISIGKHRIYVDLPFDLETGPKLIPDPKHDGLYHRDESNSGPTTTTLPTLPPSIFASTLIFLLSRLICS